MRFRPLITALFALGLVVARTATGQLPHLIFVATSSSPPSVDLDPIVAYSQGTFRELPNGDEDSASVAFRRQAYAPQAKYWLYSGGRLLGPVTARGAGQYGCTGTPGEGSTAISIPTAWQGMAASDSTLGLTTRRRHPTGLELKLLRKHADSALRAYPDFRTDSVLLAESWAVTLPDGRTWIAASFGATQPPDSLESREFSALVVLEAGRPKPVPPLVWSHLGAETSREVRTAVDILDLNHDGLPELFTSTSYYESWNYQVWSHTPDGWVESRTTGGAGC